MRRLTRFAFTAVLLLAATAPVFAGGAVWHFEGYHQPGDFVESTTAVAWDHNSELGTPEDGPFLIYLAASEDGPTDSPVIPEDALLVGIVEVHEGPYTGSDGESYGPHHAVARFEIPDVAPGTYQIFHCNDPCTTTLGDIVGGWDLRVANGDNGRAADVIAAEVREQLGEAPLIYAAAAATPVPVDRLWFWVVGAVGVVLVVRMVWSDPNRKVRTVATEPDDQTEVLR